MTDLIQVYAEVDEKQRVVRVFSSIFEQPSSEAVLLGEGVGDKYAHAHLFLDKPLNDDGGHFNYKYVNGELLERTDEEKAEEVKEYTPAPTPLEEAQARIEKLEEELMITNLYLTDLELLVFENIL